jgi:ABC-2 type transport system ATP-binding protein
MADVVALCPRVILIHHGQLLYDGELEGLARQLAPFKLVQVTLGNGCGTESNLELPPGLEIVEQGEGQFTARIARSETAKLPAQLLNTLPVVDLSVQDPPIEAVIDQVYQEGA